MTEFTLILTRTVLIAAVLVVLLAWVYRGDRAEKIRVYLSAFRLGLRDKGPTGVWDGKVWGHRFCRTQARIGIERKTKESVQYCWRCEKILARIEASGPSHEGAPPENDPDRVVISLADYKKK